jgi:hypothetical protein
VPSFIAGDAEADILQHRENRVVRASSAAKQNVPASKQKAGREALRTAKGAGREALRKTKKEQGMKPCEKQKKSRA